MADTNIVRADIATAIEAALAPLPTVTVYAYWVDNASVPSVVIDDHECHVDDRKRVNTWIVRVLLPAGPKVDSYRLGDDIVTLLTPLAVDPHSLAVESIIPTSSLLAGENMPGYTVNLTDDRKALCAERPPPPPARATGAVMGTPGYYTPVGAAPPPDAAALYTLTAEPATPWDPGTYVVTGDSLEFYWDGTAWVPGRAPTPPPPQLVLTVTAQTDLTVTADIGNEDPTGPTASVVWGDSYETTDLTHTYDDAGTYTLFARQQGRTPSPPVDVTVTEPPPPPQLVLTVTDQTDLTVAVAITNEDPTGDPVTVDWGDGTIDTQLDHTYTAAGTYTLIAEQVGRTDSEPVEVSVTAPPPSNIHVQFQDPANSYAFVTSIPAGHDFQILADVAKPTPTQAVIITSPLSSGGNPMAGAGGSPSGGDYYYRVEQWATPGPYPVTVTRLDTNETGTATLTIT